MMERAFKAYNARKHQGNLRWHQKGDCAWKRGGILQAVEIPRQPYGRISGQFSGQLTIHIHTIHFLNTVSSWNTVARAATYILRS